MRYWRIYSDYAQHLIAQAKRVYIDEPISPNLTDTVYALDSTTSDLCLSMFPWGPFRTAKAAIKLHTFLDLRGSIPSFIHISDGKLYDVNILDLLIPEADSFYVMDRAYLDYARLFDLDHARAFFVIRGRFNMDFRRVYSAPTDRQSGLICDQTIALRGQRPSKYYPQHLRGICFKDPESGKTLLFFTNQYD